MKQALNSHIFLSTFGFVFTLCSVLFPPAGDDKGSCFSFLRFIDVSPAEMSNVMLQGTLVRWAPDAFLSLLFEDAAVLDEPYSHRPCSLEI